MEIPPKCLNSYFITIFCWLAFPLQIDFCSLSLFFCVLHLFLHLWAAGGNFWLQRACGECRVGGWRPVGLLKIGHIYRKWMWRALGWSGYIPPLNIVCLHVNLPACPATSLSASVPCMWRSVLSRLYYLLSHTPSLPHFVAHCLSPPFSLIVSLYLAALQPLCLWMRLSRLL